MNLSRKHGEGQQTISQIILKAILFWSVGGLIFGVVEFWVGMAIYPWVFQRIEKFMVGPFIYTFIAMIGGGILGGISCLFYKTPKIDWLKNAQMEAFYMATNISFITFIWSIIWIWNVFNLTDLKPVANYSLNINITFMFCILGYIVYQFLGKRKDNQRSIISFISLSFSLYSFMAITIGMYLNGFFFLGLFTRTSIIYNLLSLTGSLALGIAIYYISLSLIKFNWQYRIGIVATLTLVITIIMGAIAMKKNISKDINITNRGKILNSKKPNIFLLTVDALRADHLSCYGYDKIKTPAIDSLANNGVLFINTIAQAPWTLPSFASMLTSLYPTTHGANEYKQELYKINEDVIRLPEILKDIGYSTQAFVNNPVISSGFGFGKGFDDYYNLARVQKRRAFLWTHILTDETIRSKYHTVIITQKVINWLESKAKQPFFLWVHYLDPHLPYERYKTYNLDPGYSGKLNDNEFVRNLRLDSIRDGRYNLGDSDKNYLKSIYDEEILLVDENIGLILKKLRELNLLDNTLIIFTSDHGEEFWEHDNYEHGHSLYQELVRIPLILQLPGGLPQGMRITYQVRSIDIMPTILEMLGIEHNLDIRGRSLLPMIKGEDTKYRIAFSESLFRFEERKSVRMGKYNFIYFPGSREKELYDIENDPLELKNIINEQPELGHDLQNKLLDWLKDCRNMAKILGTEKYSKPVELDKETKEKLKALGYL